MFGRKDNEDAPAVAAPEVTIKLWDAPLTDREVVDEAQRFARGFRCIVQLAERLKSVEAINQLTNEANSRLQNAQKLENEHAERLAAVKTETAEHEGRRDDALEVASGLVGEANEKVAALLADAKTQAEAMIEEARQEIVNLKEESASQIGGLRNEVQALTDQKDALGRDIAQKQQKLAKAENDIKTAKGVITKMLNAKKED